MKISIVFAALVLAVSAAPGLSVSKRAVPDAAEVFSIKEGRDDCWADGHICIAGNDCCGGHCYSTTPDVTDSYVCVTL